MGEVEQEVALAAETTTPKVAVPRAVAAVVETHPPVHASTTPAHSDWCATFLANVALSALAQRSARYHAPHVLRTGALSAQSIPIVPGQTHFVTCNLENALAYAAMHPFVAP